MSRATRLAPISGAVAPNLSNVDAAAARTALGVSRSVSLDPRDFGVVLNGATDSGALTDNTTAFQSFVTAMVTGGATGVLPPGEIRVNQKINFSQRSLWRLTGAGPNTSIIKQYANNTPILDLGIDAASLMHSVELSNFGLEYATSQPSSNTAANGIRHSSGMFQSAFRSISFRNGYYGMSLTPGLIAPWGTTFDDLQFGGNLTGGAIDWSGSLSAVPGNRFGRLFIQCTNATQTMIRARGYAWTIDTIEFLENSNGVALMELAAGALVSIGALKLEIGSFAANQSLFQFSAGCKVDIGHVHVGGTTLAVASGVTLNILKTGIGGASDGHVRIGHLMGIGTAIDGTAIAVEANEPVSISAVSLIGGFVLQNNGSSSAANRISVDGYLNHQLSDDKGDASYAVSLGDPNVASFATAFTAARTMTLPTATGALHNGVYYEFVFNGAINGSNTAVIKAGATTLATVTTDAVVIRFTWRWHVNPVLGWVMTKYEPLNLNVYARKDTVPPVYLSAILAYAAALGA